MAESFITQFREDTGDEYKDYTDIELAKAFHSKYEAESGQPVDFDEFAKEFGIVQMDPPASVDTTPEGAEILMPGSIRYEHTADGPAPVVPHGTLDPDQVGVAKIDPDQAGETIAAQLGRESFFFEDPTEELFQATYDSVGDAVSAAYNNIPEDFLQQYYGLKIMSAELRHEVLTDVAKYPDISEAGLPRYEFMGRAEKTLAKRQEMAALEAVDIEQGYKDLVESQKDREPIFVEPGSVAHYASGAVSSIGNTLPAVIAGVFLGPEVSLTMFYTQAQGKAYLDGRMSGLAPEMARDYGAYTGLAEAIPELLPLHQILKPGVNFFTRILKGTAAEVMQEEITEILQIELDKGYIKPDMTWAEARSRLVDAGVLATIVGPTQAAIAHPLVKAKEAFNDNTRKLGRELDKEISATEFTDMDLETIAAMDPNLYAPENSAQASIIESAQEFQDLDKTIAEFEGQFIPVEGDRRISPERAKAGDRRVDVEQRKKVAEMTPEEMGKELLTSRVTGIKNDRAYDEAEKLPVQVSIDADSLKWVNDNMSMESGNEMLKTIGKVLSEETEDAYHVSGDEFISQANTEEEATQLMDRVNARLEEAEIYVERPDGEIVIKKGLSITHGLGGTKADADFTLKQEKIRKEEAGERAARGEEPPGVTRKRAERQPDIEDRVTPEEITEVEPAPDRRIEHKQAVQNAKSVADAITIYDKAIEEAEAAPVDAPREVKDAPLELEDDLIDLTRRLIKRANTTEEVDQVMADFEAAGWDETFTGQFNTVVSAKKTEIASRPEVKEKAIPEGLPGSNKLLAQLKGQGLDVYLETDTLTSIENLDRDISELSKVAVETELRAAVSEKVKTKYDIEPQQERKRVLEALKSFRDQIEKAAETLPKPVDTKRVAKLRKTADGMEKQIDAKLKPAVADQTPTPRRSRILAGMRADGEKLQRIQGMLRDIADQTEAGTLDPLLEKISTRAEIETIISRENPPAVIWHPRDTRQLEEAIKGLRGVKEDRQFMKDRFDWREGALEGREMEVLDRLIKAAHKRGSDIFKATFTLELLQQWKRVNKLGIKNEKDWNATRDALTALDRPVDPKQKKAETIDQMERALVGRKIPGFFPTPEHVIERMLDEAQIVEGELVLEPSAGSGAIMDAIKVADVGAEVEGLEYAQTLQELLKAKDHKIIGEDFMKYEGGPYDKIVMNPPFEKNQDIAHVLHAYSLLRPGGRIVSIMSEHPFFASDKASKDFRKWLDEIDHTTEKLPDAFRKGKIRTTGVSSRMVVINKPEAQEAKKPEPVEAPKKASGVQSIEYGKQHSVVNKPTIEVKITLKNGDQARVAMVKDQKGWSLMHASKPIGVIMSNDLNYSTGYTKRGAKQVLEYVADRAIGVKDGSLVFEGDPRDVLRGIEGDPAERWVAIPKANKAPKPAKIGFTTGQPWFKVWHGMDWEQQSWSNGHVLVVGKTDILDKKIKNLDTIRGPKFEAKESGESVNKIIEVAIQGKTEIKPIALNQADPLRESTEQVIFDINVSETEPLTVNAEYYRLFKNMYPEATFKTDGTNIENRPMIAVYDGDTFVGTIMPMSMKGVSREGFPAEKIRQYAKDVGARDPSKPRGGGGGTVAMSTKVNSWSPGENYAGAVNQMYVPDERTFEFDRDPIRRESVLRNFAKNMGIRLYQGRVKGKQVLGFFRPGIHEIRIKNVNDLETAAHEIAHYIDDVVWNGFGRRRGEKETRPWLHGPKARIYAKELKTISYDKTKVYEGFAEYVRHWTSRPEIAERAAPEFTKYWKEFLKTSDFGPALMQAQEEIMGYLQQRAIERAASKFGDADMAINQVHSAMKDRARQYVVDDLNGLLVAQSEVLGDISKVSGTPYETSRLMRAAHSVVSGALEYGPPMVINNEWVFRDRDGNPDHTIVMRDGKQRAVSNPDYKKWGLNDVLAPVAHQLDEWTLYATGMSANELMEQGREHLFTRDEIDAMVDLGRDRPHFKKALDDYQKWNNAILDFAIWSGIISKRQRKSFQRSIYIPFYRVAHGNAVSKKAVPGHIKPVQRLTGGQSNLNNILDNMVQNATNLIVEGIKNNARRETAQFFSQKGGGQYMAKIAKDTKAVEIDKDQVIDTFMKGAFGMTYAQYKRLSDAGQGKPNIDAMLAEVTENLQDYVKMYMYGQPPKGSNLVAVMIEGKPVFYEVADPLLMRSFDSFSRVHHVNSNAFGRAFSLAKRVGQGTITLTLNFVGANIFRDTISGTILSSHGFVPLVDSLRGMKSRIMRDANYRQYIANGGGFASYLVDPEAFESHLRHFYQERGISFKSVLHTPKKALLGLELVADSFEMATRLGENYRALERGETPRTATFSGREISADFAMRGDSEALGILYDTVMFLKAGIVGLDREIRGFTRDANNAKVMAYTAGLAAASTVLYMMNRGNPCYDELEDWDKDVNWHVLVPRQGGGTNCATKYVHLRFPKPWQFGAISSAAERSAEAALDKVEKGYTDGPEYAKKLQKIFTDLYKMEYVPQMLAPPYETYALNKNRFTGRPIETENEQDLLPFARYTPYTNKTLVAMAELTAELPPELQFSPKRAEAMLRKYFNTWASIGLGMSDQILFGDQLPEKRIEEYQGISRFTKAHPLRRTQSERQFWDMLKESNMYTKTASDMVKKQNERLAELYIGSDPALINETLQDVRRVAGDLNQSMIAIHEDPELTRQQKREQIDDLQREKNKLFYEVMPQLKAAREGVKPMKGE